MGEWMRQRRLKRWFLIMGLWILHIRDTFADWLLPCVCCILEFVWNISTDDNNKKVTGQCPGPTSTSSSLTWDTLKRLRRHASQVMSSSLHRHHHPTQGRPLKSAKGSRASKEISICTVWVNNLESFASVILLIIIIIIKTMTNAQLPTFRWCEAPPFYHHRHCLGRNTTETQQRWQRRSVVEQSTLLSSGEEEGQEDRGGAEEAGMFHISVIIVV